MSVVNVIHPDRMSASTDEPLPGRDVIFRTRGRGHGEVFRLISPSDLGEHSSHSFSSIASAA